MGQIRDEHGNGIMKTVELNSTAVGEITLPATVLGQLFSALESDGVKCLQEIWP